MLGSSGGPTPELRDELVIGRGGLRAPWLSGQPRAPHATRTRCAVRAQTVFTAALIQSPSTPIVLYIGPHLAAARAGAAIKLRALEKGSAGGHGSQQGRFAAAPAAAAARAAASEQELAGETQALGLGSGSQGSGGADLAVRGKG